MTKKERGEKLSSLHHALLPQLPCPPRTPIWFMRQAGRSLPEYRALRHRTHASMLECCLIPEVAALATLQPVRRHGVDAAILFSDIMTPLLLSGVDVRIEAGIGPIISTPARTGSDIAHLTRQHFGTGQLPFCGTTLTSSDAADRITHTISILTGELGTAHHAPQPSGLIVGAQGATQGEISERSQAGLTHSHGSWGWTPLIAFAGAPFTLAAYLVEGRPSRDHLAARSLMLSDPHAWDALMRWCAHISGEFLALQISAGASVAQLFDSWAGSLSPELYRHYVAPYSAITLHHAAQAISPTLGTSVPIIHFGTASALLIDQMAHIHPAVAGVGVDERVSLREALSILTSRSGQHTPHASAHEDDNHHLTTPAIPALQGNINPAILNAPWHTVRSHVDSCLEQGRQAPGHIVNLGHGVPKDTDPTVLTRIVAHVHNDEQWSTQVANDAQEPWCAQHTGLDVHPQGDHA